jgi:hypothetical protein
MNSWRLVAIICLVALGALSFRPAAARVLQIHPDPAETTIIGLPDGGHYCVISSVCATLTASSVGLDFPHDVSPLVISGLVFVVLATSMRVLSSTAVAFSSPPPRQTDA